MDVVSFRLRPGTGRAPSRWFAVLALCALGSSTALGCRTYQPKPIDEVPFMERAQTQVRDGFRVRAAVLSSEESQAVFGVALAKHKIQPVWLEIENLRGQPSWFMLSGLDPSYFSPHEAAYINHFSFRGGTNARMDERFRSLAIRQDIQPGQMVSGFVFSVERLGTREVRVILFSTGSTETFRFEILVPGLRVDYQEIDFDSHYASDEMVDYETEDELRAAIERFQCCTTLFNGSGKGDPLNLVLIGDGLKIKSAFLRAGWDETEVLTAGSAWKTFKAGLFGTEYRYSPMSSLYVFGRHQDAGFQKTRKSIHERNHLRIWLTPARFQGKEVWVGTITRDIGIYFTTKAWNLTTHAIDPHTDEARSYLAEDLAMVQAIEKIGHVGGVGAATSEDPHRNLMLAPWWTDGLREVLLFSDTPVALDQIRFFSWVGEDSP